MPTIEPRRAAAETPEVVARGNGRLDALRRVGGAHTGLYEPGYLDDLRAEWPE